MYCRQNEVASLKVFSSLFPLFYVGDYLKIRQKKPMTKIKFFNKVLKEGWEVQKKFFKKMSTTPGI